MDKEASKQIDNLKHDIRHYLAIERTKLANERTLLSYVRTSLTLLIVGISFLHFTDSSSLQWIAFIFIPSGIFTFVYGTFWYYKRKKSIMQNEKVLNL